MAGVEFAKYNLTQGHELGVHLDNDIRSNKGINHSNITINKDLTHLNYYLGVNTYTELMSKIEEKVIYADQHHPNKRKSKKRKEMFSLEVPCPPELEGTPQEDDFYKKVYDMYKKMLPGIVGACIHKDEKHEYYDSKKQEMMLSRNHMHILGACITKDGRCHTSDTITPEVCQKVQDDIQNLCLEEYGISYQTGEGRTGEKKTVEELKAESQVKLQEKLAKENLTVVEELREEKEILKAEVEESDAIVKMNENIIFQQDEQISHNQEILNEILDNISKSKEELVEVKKEVSDTNAILTKFNKLINDFYHITVPVLNACITKAEMALNGIKEVLKPKLEAKLQTPRENAQKGLKQANSIISKMNEEIVFGRGNHASYNKMKKATEDFEKANTTIRTSALEMANIINNFDFEEEEDFER